MIVFFLNLIQIRQYLWIVSTILLYSTLCTASVILSRSPISSSSYTSFNSRNSYSIRYGDCNRCFSDSNDLSKCRQLVLTCASTMKLSISISDSNDISMFYEHLMSSYPRLREDIYCVGMYSMMIKEREDDCKMDIGSARDISTAGMSYALRQQFGPDSSISCLGWTISNGHITSVLNRNGISKTVNEEQHHHVNKPWTLEAVFGNLKIHHENVNTIRRALVTVSTQFEWEPYFSKNQHDITVIKLSNTQVKVLLKPR